MRNERGAGRKPKITAEKLLEIIERRERGESMSSLAKEYGVSRQALYARINLQEEAEPIQMDYIVDGKCATRIFIEKESKNINIENVADRLSLYAFGIKSTPSWDDFSSFLEKIYLENIGLSNNAKSLWINEGRTKFSLKDVLENSENKLNIRGEIGAIDEKIFTISKQDILYSRTDTDGFQLKALSKDRQWFIKAQAVIGEKYMDDWRVEIIASDLAKQLNIPCVEQSRCQVIFGKNKYDAVYSKNFELDGFEFVSFDSLIRRMGFSTYDKEFIRRNAIEKLEWCAEKLSVIGRIPFEDTLKHMIDLAVIDCLVGNVDRHTKNFGLFFDSIRDQYQVPLIFDNGMGLFEHDVYRDQYENFDEAMRNVCVSPYGEDPFDLIQMLDEKYGLKKVYPNINRIQYLEMDVTPLATEYMIRMVNVVRKL